MQEESISSIELDKVLQKVKRIGLTLEIKLNPRQNRSQKNSKKNCLNKDKKNVKKTFHKKSKVLQVSRVTVPNLLLMMIFMTRLVLIKKYFQTFP